LEFLRRNSIISCNFRIDPLGKRDHFSKLILIHFQEEIMISRSSHQRNIGHDRKRPQFIIILAALLMILALYLPAVMAENVSGS
jgi:hypothetical protein